MSRDLQPLVHPEKYYEPEKWTSLHRYIVLLEIAGKKPGQIAEIMDMSSSRISVILGDKRAELDRIQIGSSVAAQMTDIHTKLSLYAHEALEVIVEEMRDFSNKAELRVKAGFGILDRAGFTPLNKQFVPQTELPLEIAERMEAVSLEMREDRPIYNKVEPKLLEGAEETF
jgi:hypothetical protein